MHELISPFQAERVLLFVAIGGPLFGLIVGIMVGAHCKRALPSVVAGAMIGALGTVAFGLWKAYNAIVAAMGLDSVANLALQIVLFTLFGGLLGTLIYRVSLIYHRPR